MCDAALGEERVPPRVMLTTLDVIPTVDLDDDPLGRRVEVDAVAADRMLATKACAELRTAKYGPQNGLGF